MTDRVEIFGHDELDEVGVFPLEDIDNEQHDEFIAPDSGFDSLPTVIVDLAFID